MDYLKIILEKFKPLDHERNDATQDRLGNPNAIKFIKATSIHVLHAIVDTGFYEESAVKFDDGCVYGAVENVEFHDDCI